jgi:hypothetical protein
VQVAPRPVGPNFFNYQSTMISGRLSSALHSELQQQKLLDGSGHLKGAHGGGGGMGRDRAALATVLVKASHVGFASWQASLWCCCLPFRPHCCYKLPEMVAGVICKRI